MERVPGVPERGTGGTRISVASVSSSPQEVTYKSHLGDYRPGPLPCSLDCFHPPPSGVEGHDALK